MSFNPTIPANVVRRFFTLTIAGAIVGLLIANLAYGNSVIARAETEAIERLRMEGVPEEDLKKEFKKRYRIQVVYWNAPHIPWVMGGLGFGAGAGAIIATVWGLTKSKTNSSSLKSSEDDDQQI